MLIANAGRKKGSKSTTLEDLFNEEDDKDFDPEAEEEDDIEDDSGSVGSGDEEVIKSGTAATKKKPRPAKEAARKKVLKEESLEQAFSNMSIQATPFSMEFKCPYIMYSYMEHGRQCVSIDFLVPNQHRRTFRLSVANNKVLELGIVVPPIFYDPRRMLAANEFDKGFNRNTNKATAFEKQCKEIVKKHGKEIENPTDDDSDDVEVCVGKQCVKLPFDVEEDLWRGPLGDQDGFEVQVFENDDNTLTDELGQTTEYFILSVDMVSVEKEKPKKARGTIRKITSPRIGKAPDEMEEEGREGEE